MDDNELRAWVAGFFDGEGCISCTLRKQYSYKYGFKPRHHMNVSQSYNSINDLDFMIDRLDSYCDMVDSDLSHIINNRGGNHRDSYMIQTSNLDYIDSFLGGIVDYLCVKRKEVEIMLYDIIPLIKSDRNRDVEWLLDISYHIDRLSDEKGWTRKKYDTRMIMETIAPCVELDDGVCM